MKLTFLGATKTVTGSKYLLEYQGKRILIDCGLFQGYKELRLRNWEALPIDPRTVDAVILTHAHVDHSGYLPRFVNLGFSGPVYCTPATRDLCKILLPDCGHIQEFDAQRANRYKYTKHPKALPLYTEKEARDTLKHLIAVQFENTLSLWGILSVTFHHAGHILGAASVEIKSDTTSILFSGDIGRLQDPILKAPAPIAETEYVVVESTYGNRRHEKEATLDILEKVIYETLKRGGSVLIPAFAVGRAQSLLYNLYKLKETHRIPKNIPVFLDSPMAANVSVLLNKYQQELNLSAYDCKKSCRVAAYTRSVEDSKAINAIKHPKIIIAASGMATGGRVVHHLKNMLPDSRNTILFAGYQAGGTRGARLLNGETELKMFGAYVTVKAKIEMIPSLSGHADYQELLTWLSSLKKAPKKIFITHGEITSAESFSEKLKTKFGWNPIIPNYLDTFEL